MLDGISLDHLRVFIAAVDEGSFSAAARRLRRAQSAVSQALANLEAQLGLKLFDRSSRYPALTDLGRALLLDARSVITQVDQFKTRAVALAGGLEPELSVAADVTFPIDIFTSAVAAFQEQFPSTALKLYIEGWGGVVQYVLDGRCGVGVLASYQSDPPQFAVERLLTVPMMMVVSPQHPLAAFRGPIPRSTLADHILIVHTNRLDFPVDRGIGALSPRNWLMTHLGAKLAFLRAGFGFGLLPLHEVAADLANGALVSITAEDAPPWISDMRMSAVYRTDNPPGPAGRWLIDQLKKAGTHAAQKPAVSADLRTVPARRPRSQGQPRPTSD